MTNRRQKKKQTKMGYEKQSVLHTESTVSKSDAANKKYAGEIGSKESAAGEDTVEGKQISDSKTGKGTGKGRRFKMAANGILSLIAVIMSAIALYYSDREYRYKLDPEIEVQGSMRMNLQRNEDGTEMIDMEVLGTEINILQKNNLQSAYLIHADNRVEKLKINGIENTIESELDKQIELGEPDFVVNNVAYSYKFLFVSGLDDSYQLFLLYIRDGEFDIQSDEEAYVGFRKVDSIEMWELEKAHVNDKNYEGERELAKRYMEVMEGCEKYLL